MADEKTPSETPTQPESVAAPAATASAPVPTTTPEPKVEPKVDAPATGVNEGEAKALADAAKAVADKAVTDQALADSAAAAAKALTEVPDNYALDLPSAIQERWKKEGLTVDTHLITGLTPALKEAKLTNAQFNKVAAAFIELQSKLPEQMMARDMETTKADPAIGGLNYARSMEEVTVALDAFADPDFKKFVVRSGIANKLEFVRVFQRIGAAMRKAGDSPARGAPDAAPPETMAQRMYGRKKTT
jgi:hypothetical protein